MEKSTHRIEWQPMPKPESDPVFEPENTGDGMSASELAKGLSEISDEINDEFI